MIEDAQHVDKAVINPMRRRYRPPKNLREDEDALEDALDMIRRALLRFDKPVLEKAWQMAVERNEIECWPKLKSLVEAAEHFHRLAHRNDNADEWALRATEMADAYWRKFSKTAVAVRAREGGYEPRLKEYVREASCVQAQMIMRRENLAYTSNVLFPGLRDEAAEAEWFNQAKAQAQTGEIKVKVPPAIIERLKAEAAGQRAR